MISEKMLLAINQLNNNKPNLTRTQLYPNIDKQSLDLVKIDFPEVDFLDETPLLLSMRLSGVNDLRWIFVSDKRIYYRLFSFPSIMTALDCIALNKTESFKIKIRWVYNHIELNNKVIGNIVIGSIIENIFVEKAIKAIIANCDRNEIINEAPRLEYFPNEEWKHLDNAAVFTIIDDYFSNNNQGGRLWGFYDFKTNPFIDQEKIDQARKVYADYNPIEEIPVLFVDDLMPEPSGIMITNKYIYYKLMPALFRKYVTGKIQLNKVNSFRIKPRFFGLIYVNGQRLGTINALNFASKSVQVFEDLVNLMIKEVKDQNN